MRTTKLSSNGFEMYWSKKVTVILLYDPRGNYWNNFNGIIPYNNSRNIEYGGDYEPLNLLMVSNGPLVPAPLNAIVVVPIYAAYMIQDPDFL